MELLYNPDAMSKAEFEATFVGREALLQELLDLVRGQPDGAGVQHAVVIAPRGMGKTSLLQRFRYAVLESDLASAWLPLKFPEELYGVVDLTDFWLETLRLLAVETGEPEWAEKAQTLPGRFGSRTDVAAAALALLKDYRRRNGKRLLLLVENLDMLFETLPSEADNARLRDTLMNDGMLLLVGSSVSFFDQARAYDQPLYNFFRLFNLNPLSFEESRDLLSCRAKEDRNTGLVERLQTGSARLRTLHYFTQGIPRLVVMLYQMVAQSDVGGARQALEKLLDGVTPYYKARVETLPAQPRKLLDYVARAAAKTHEGVSPKQLAAAIGLPPNQVNVQLTRLADAGYLRSVPLRGRAACYVLSEPLYSLWHQMRLNPETRTRKLGWLVDFLHDWYDDRERAEEAERLYSRFNECERSNDGIHALAVAEHLHLLAQSAVSTPEVGKVMFHAVKALSRARDKQIEPAKMTEMLDEQRANIEEALAAYPYDAKLLAAKGYLLLWKDNKYEAAVGCFDRALESDPKFVSAWTSRGTALYFLKRYNQALAADETALKIDPNDSVVWNNYGLTLRELGRLAEALDAFNQALALDHGNTKATSNRASLREEYEDKFLEAVALNRLDNARSMWMALGKLIDREVDMKISKRCLLFASVFEHYDVVRELIKSAELQEELFVMDRAVEYLKIKEEALLEKLSPEIKEAVEQVVNDLRSSIGTRKNSSLHFVATARLWAFEDYVAKRGRLVHKLKAKDSTGRWAYYFVLVLTSMEKAFLQALKCEGMIDLENYGRVIASCYGEAPNEEIKSLLKEKYGFSV